MVKEMRSSKHLATPRFLFLTLSLALGGGLLLAACLGGSAGAGTANSQPTPATQANQPKPQAAQPQAKTQAGPTAAAKNTQNNPDVEVDACKLLARDEIESAVGASVLEPLSGRLAELSTCSYGDPEAPLLNGRPVFSTVALSVFTGSDSAFVGGAAAQARGVYDIAKKNAGDLNQVPSLGEEAHWVDALKSLRVVQGRYFIDIQVYSGGQEAAKGLASKMLERLP